MTDKVPARHKLTGDIYDVRPDAVDKPGGFFESLPTAKASRRKRDVVDTPVAIEAAPITETDPASGAPTNTEE